VFPPTTYILSAMSVTHYRTPGIILLLCPCHVNSKHPDIELKKGTKYRIAREGVKGEKMY